MTSTTWRRRASPYSASARAACSCTRSSARMLAVMVLRTIPMLSPSWSRKAIWMSLRSSIDASSITARVSSSNRIGRRTIGSGRRAAERRCDRRVVGRHVTKMDPPAVLGRLAQQALAEPDHRRRRRGDVARIGRQQAETGRLPIEIREVEHAALDADQRGQLGQDQPADHLEVALALQQLTEFGRCSS